jgi:hypothetical protein
MPAPSVARIVAGAIVSLLAAAGLVAPPASALSSVTRTLTGHVYLTDSAHPAGADEVWISTQSVGVHTDASGAYSITFTAADTTAYISLTAMYQGDGPYPTYTNVSVPLPASDVGVQDVTLLVQQTISGHVTDSSGRPLAGVTATLWIYQGAATSPEFRQIDEAVTDSTGRYRLTGRFLPSGSYAVGYELAGYAPQTWPDSGIAYAPGLIPIGAHEARDDVDAILYRGATVSGVLAVANGSADDRASYSGVDVQVKDRMTAAWRSIGDLEQPALDGSWTTTESLPPGTYRWFGVYAGPLGTARVASAPVTLGEGGHASFSPKLRPFQRDLNDEDRDRGGYYPDVVVRGASGGLRVYPSNGSGGFLPTRTYSLESTYGMLHARANAVLHAGAFVTGDGDDFIVRDDRGVLHLHRSIPGIGAIRGGSTEIGHGWGSMTALLSPGDFDGDGAGDVLARDRSGSLWMYRGNGKGGWKGAVKIGSGWSGYTSLFAAGDMNEDGFLDIAARDAAGGLWLYPGNGSGGWKPRVKIGVGWNSMTAIFSVGDFDGDSRADVIARDRSGYLWLYPGTGGGGLGARHRIGTGWNGLVFVN